MIQLARPARLCVSCILKSALAGLAVALAVTCAPGVARAQGSMAAVPIFQGAALDAGALGVVRSERGGIDDMAAVQPRPPAARDTKVYSTTAGAEDVFAFYVKAMNARPWGDSGPDEPGTVKRGGSSRPAWSVEPYEEELQDTRAEATGEVMRQGAWVRKVLSARTPFGGKWIGTGTIAWSATDKDGAVTMFRVVIQDRSFDKDGGKFSKTRSYIQATYILVDSATWK